MKKTLILLAFSVFMLFETACKKEGPQGPAGAAGTNGNANVKEFTFMSQGFSWVAADGMYEMYVNIPELTQVVVDKGAVMVYLQPASSTGAWLQAPLSWGSQQINAAYTVGQVGLVESAQSTGLFNIKVVIIPQ